jgi:UDP-N-acetylglucosamine 2-epimerase (non-hydrolysing)
MVVFGTRPEAIKLAPLLLVLERSSAFELITVVTAQHREMLDQVLEFFSIKPRYDLDIMREAQTLTSLTAGALEGLAPLIESERPEVMIVQGDTTTTLAGALAGFYHQVPVVHLEAGLRTGDLRAPFPEEANRRLTTQVTSLHLAPTVRAMANLLREGVVRSAVVVTGNTVIDALMWSAAQSAPYGDACLEELDRSDRRVLLVTAHRRESWGVRLREIARALADLARMEPELAVVLPIHRNPVVRAAMLPELDGLANVTVREPLAYGPFARLLSRAHLVLTDSGGLQEEAPALGKPVLVMRDTTERPEGVAAGNALLVGLDRRVIVDSVRHLLHDQETYEAMAIARNPFGDGHAAVRAAAAIAHLLGDAPEPSEFGDPGELGERGETGAPGELGD